MANYNKVNSSGKKQKFKSGAVRDNREGKGRYDLLPPHAIFRLAKHYENGAKRYNDRNWEKGQPLSRFLDSALRHIFRFLEGSKDEDHMSAAAWNIMGLIETEKRIEDGKLPKELNDLKK